MSATRPATRTRPGSDMACLGFCLLMLLGVGCGSDPAKQPAESTPDAGTADARDASLALDAALQRDGRAAPATPIQDESGDAGADEKDDGALPAPADAGGPSGPDAAVRSDVVGKVTVGYQGWFAAVGDGSPANVWWHYDGNTQKPPSPSDVFIKAWPDMSEYTTTFQTGFSKLGNGAPATLFSSFTPQTVDTHVRWLKENGIDTAALQRFNDYLSTRNAVATNLKNASEKYDRKFYIMYDISGWTKFESELPSDWKNVIVDQLKLTSSPAYAMQDGKPVVCIWGCGFDDRPGNTTSCGNVIQAFKQLGLYVIGGVPRDWRTQGGTPSWSTVYDAFDMISPWMIGAIGNAADSDNYRKTLNEPDVAYCKSHNIAYQPCVIPGDLSVRQRKHGDFMWHQFANMIQIGAPALYISMFDEYNEGNQIAKTAASAATIPTNSTFLTLDEDGTACSSDYYLRLTGDGGKMLKGQIPFTFQRPTSPQ